MKVQSYGRLADHLGAEREIEILRPCTVGELRALLAAQYPDAAATLSSNRFRACVGDKFVSDDHILSMDGSIELLAPVSGG